MGKYKQYFYDLFWSVFKTKNLFKFAFYSFITPLLVLIFVIGLMAVPSIIAYNSLSIENVTSNTLYIDKVMAYALDQDIKCSINDNKLSCDEEYSYETLYEFKNNNNDTIKYKIYVNSDVSSVTFTTGQFGQHYDTDNYLIFFESTFVYRYTYHDPKTETVTEYQSYGFYDDLNGIDLSKIKADADIAENKEEYLLNQGNLILLDGCKAVARQSILTSVVADVGVYALFMLVVALLIKGNYMLKRTKGFKYTQAFKIGMVSSIQPALIALLFSLMGMSFMNIFGLALTVRILYIYIRYTGSRKNTAWIEEIYSYTKDERFNP